MSAGDSVYIAQDLYYRRLSKENFEEVIELFLDTFLENPGNPVWLVLQVGRAVLESYWRPIIQQHLEHGFMDLIFYYRGRAAAFVLAEDLYDSCTEEPSHPNPMVFWKQGIDKRLADETRKHFKRGDLASLCIGVNSKTGFERMFSLIDKEIMCLIPQYGFKFTGSHIFNPRTVSIVKRNGGYIVFEIDKDTLEFEGKKVFKESNVQVCCCYTAVPLGEEIFKAKYQFLLPRFYELQQKFKLAAAGGSKL